MAGAATDPGQDGRDAGQPERTPEDRQMHARIAAHHRWAHEPDRRAATAPARRAALERFERQVDPDGVLPPDERARRATSARKAYFIQLARKSALVRREKALTPPRRRRTANHDAA